jgi:hypothetical protein
MTGTTVLLGGPGQAAAARLDERFVPPMHPATSAGVIRHEQPRPAVDPGHDFPTGSGVHQGGVRRAR